MAISDTVVANLTTLYLAVIAGMKLYGLITGKTFTGVFVLGASTALVGLVLVLTLTWDVSRKATHAVSRVHVAGSGGGGGGEMCRGGICWHGVAVKSPASQVWFRLPQHNHHFGPNM